MVLGICKPWLSLEIADIKIYDCLASAICVVPKLQLHPLGNKESNLEIWFSVVH